jgi:AcrR family transcriptional regulator
MSGFAVEARAAGRRERRKAETRRRLLEAARALFVERGYHATRPQDVAERADLAAGTFYVHFADKRDVFLAFTAWTAEELMERIRAAARDAAGLEGRLEAALRALLAFSDEHPGVLRVCFADEAVITTGAARRASLRDRLVAVLADGLRAGMRSREVRDDYDPRLVACGVVGFVQHALTFGAHESLDRETLLANVIRFCGRALRRPLPEAPPA